MKRRNFIALTTLALPVAALAKVEDTPPHKEINVPHIENPQWDSVPIHLNCRCVMISNPETPNEAFQKFLKNTDSKFQWV